MKIIFDLDGTLLDVADRHHMVYSEVVKEFHGKALTKEEYWGLKREKTSWSSILQRTNVSEDKLYSFLDSFVNKIEQQKYLKLDKLFPDSIKTLSALSMHQLYLISLRRSEEALLKELEDLGIKNKFKKILSGHTEKEGFELKANLIKEISPKPQDMVIGDTEADILMAKKLNLKSVAVLSGIRSKKFLEELNPDYIVASISNLPNLLTRL